MLCPACGNNVSRCLNLQFGHRKQTSWRYCLSCESFFDSAAFDKDNEIAHLQNTDYGRDDLGISLCEFKMPMYDAVLKLLKNHAPPPASLLDVGCSYGGFLLRAREEGYRVLGSDINARAVNYVNSLRIPAVCSYSIRDINVVETGSLDAVTCLDCNCYWSNQPSELRYALEKLKPGGHLAMRVVDKSWMFRLGLRLTNLAPTLGMRVVREAANDHRFSMPLNSLLKVIGACGFEVIYTSPRGAVHNSKTRWIARASFTIGSLLWSLSGVFVAPGALVLARKPSNKPVPCPGPLP